MPTAATLGATNQSANHGARSFEGYANLLAAYCFLSPWVYIPVASRIYLSAVDILAPIAIIMLLMRPVFGQVALSLLAVGYIVWVAIQALVSIYVPFDVIKIIRLANIFAPILISGIAFQLSPSQLRKLVRSFWFGLTIAVGAGILLYVAGIRTRDLQQEIWLAGGRSVARLGGITGNTAEFGHISALWLLTGLLFTKFITRRHVLLLRVMSVATFAYVLLFSSSRAALLDVAAGLFLYFAMLAVGDFKKLLQMVAGASLAMLLYVGMLFSLRGTSPVVDASLARIDFLGLAFTDPAPGGNTRLQTWQLVKVDDAIGLFEGVGYKGSFLRYRNAIDNAFLSNYAELGLTGAVIFLTLFIWLTWQVRKSLVPKQHAVAMSAIIGGTLVHGMTLDFHTLWASTPALLALAVGFLKVNPAEVGRCPSIAARST